MARRSAAGPGVRRGPPARPAGPARRRPHRTAAEHRRRAAASRAAARPPAAAVHPARLPEPGPVPGPAHQACGATRMTACLYDLQRPEVIADPWPWYRSLQHTDGPYWDSTTRVWLVSRHADVVRLLADPHMSAVTDHARAARFAPTAMRHLFTLLDAHVSFLDPPGHTRLRAVLADPFRRNRVHRLQSYIAAAVDAILGHAATAGGLEVMADLASTIPLLVVRHLLGLDGVDLPTLRRWSHAWGDVVAAPGHLPTGDTGQLLADVNDLIEHLHQVVSAHRAQSRDTVTAPLVRAADDGRLTETELIANLMMLVTAGLLARCTGLRPAGPRTWRLNGNLRGLASLPVAFTPTPAGSTDRLDPGEMS